MLTTLVHDNQRLLDQLERALLPVGLEEYTHEAPELGLSPLGAHTRHVLDVYDALLQGHAQGRVDYDARARDHRTEQDRSHALLRIRRTHRALGGLISSEDRSLRVRLDAAPGEALWTQSSLGRELVACASHTVHHLALMAVLLRSQGHPPEDGFGVAPSTLRHWEIEAACVR